MDILNEALVVSAWSMVGIFVTMLAIGVATLALTKLFPTR